jgi:hypothetical protein
MAENMAIPAQAREKGDSKPIKRDKLYRAVKTVSL